MEPFDNLKQQWKSQKLDKSIDIDKLKMNVVNSLINDQKKMIFTNLILSVAFAAVFMVLAWIWTSHPDRSIYFYASLTGMGVLLTVTLAGFWTGVQYKNEHTYKSTVEFITANIQKLNIRKFMLQKFVPAYLILLLLCLYFYFADILRGSEPMAKVLAYGLTTIYVAGVFYFSRGKRARQIKHTEDLRLDLEDLKEQLE
ncbi:hypothetical protein [Rhodohalobacter sp.]|uniref:hypothetical protein n=1 Tax=Rhodohalobacter sp. TaxID=1974210 RepID=UPI002ACD93BE|nr:hypothetical protein [Rhodohalobacter sp.]MDZ7757993.1 hypothetical protein [Rhodohalobacter sp.]